MLNIKGTTKKDDIDLYEGLVGFVVDKLIGVRNPELTINLEVTDKVHRRQRWGNTLALDPENELPQKYQIDISPRPGTGQRLVILSHELVHVKQFTLGEFRYLPEAEVRWRGEVLSLDDFEYDMDHPWEIEANGRERALVYQFVEEYGHQRKRWFKDWSLMAG
jgi:hypothetical protein